jgi:hypothetical protein
MSEVNRAIYLRHLTKECDTLKSWAQQLRRAGNTGYASEMERRASDVRRSMIIVEREFFI